MTVRIEITGEDAGHALRELRDLVAAMQGHAAAAVNETAVSATEEKPAEEPKKATRTRKAKAEEPAAISTGEERVGPEDSPETAAQDAADEQAEVETARDPEKPLTADDLRNAMGLYVNKFGMPETQDDGPSIFLDALGTPPDGEQFWKLTVVASKGQDTLKKAVDAWKAAAAAGKRYGK